MSEELVLAGQLLANEGNIKMQNITNKVLAKIKKLKGIIQTKPDPAELERLKKKLDKFSEILRTIKKVNHLSAVVADRLQSKPPKNVIIQKGIRKQSFGNSNKPKQNRNQINTNIKTNKNSNKQKTIATKNLQSSLTTKLKKNYVTLSETDHNNEQINKSKAVLNQNLQHSSVAKSKKNCIKTSEGEKVDFPKNVKTTEINVPLLGRGLYYAPDLGNYPRLYNPADRGTSQRGGTVRGRGAYRGRGTFHGRGAPRGRGTVRGKGSEIRVRGAKKSLIGKLHPS